jgi:hypothetical protein
VLERDNLKELTEELKFSQIQSGKEVAAGASPRAAPKTVSSGPEELDLNVPELK